MPHLPPDALRGLFEYRWSQSNERPNLGFALYSGAEIVGFLGAIYADRSLAGRLVRTCNLTTAYVRPEFRWASLKLLAAAISDERYVMTSFTPSPTAAKILTAFGFQQTDHSKRVYLPWHFGRAMFRPAAKLLTAPDEIAPLLEGESRRFLEDHLPYGLKHYLWLGDGARSYFVLRRRRFPGHVAFGRSPVRKLKLMWYPCMEMLYLDHAECAMRDWDRIAPAIIRRERVLAVVGPERLLGSNAPPGAHMEYKSFVLSREALPGTLDCLYSELAVLPI